MTNADKKIKSLLINEAILLAFIPFIGYVIGYYYEYGYLSFFHIPSSLISVDTIVVLRAVKYLVVYMLLGMILCLVSYSFLKKDSSVDKSVGVIAMYISYLLVVFGPLLGTVFYVIAILIFTFIFFVILFILKK